MLQLRDNKGVQPRIFLLLQSGQLSPLLPPLQVSLQYPAFSLRFLRHNKGSPAMADFDLLSHACLLRNWHFKERLDIRMYANMFKAKNEPKPTHIQESIYNIRLASTEQDYPQMYCSRKTITKYCIKVLPKHAAAQHSEISPEKMHIVTPHVTWNVLLLSSSLLVFLLAT